MNICDLSKVYSPVNSCELKIGSIGYLTDKFGELNKDDRPYLPYQRVTKIDKYTEYPFYAEGFDEPFRYFYLVQEA